MEEDIVSKILEKEKDFLEATRIVDSSRIFSLPHIKVYQFLLLFNHISHTKILK